MTLAELKTSAPALPRSLLFSWGLRLASGWLVALPLICAVGTSGIDALPKGERALFEPGALWLVEVVRHGMSALAAGLRAGFVYLICGLLLRAFAAATLFCAAFGAADFRQALARGCALAGRFVAIGLLELVVHAAFTTLLFVASRLLQGALALRNEALDDLLPLGLALPGLALWAGVSIIGDVLRAQSLAQRRPLLDLIAPSIECARGAALPLFGGYALCGGLGVLAVSSVARAVELLDVGRAGTWRVLAVFVLHCATLFFLVALDAWFIRRVVDVTRANERA